MGKGAGKIYPATERIPLICDRMIHLAVDLLGADTPEEELCRGAVRALVGNPALFLHLCGHADVLSAVTAEIGAAEIAGRYEIVDAPVARGNNEDPMQAYQRTDALPVRRHAVGSRGGSGRRHHLRRDRRCAGHLHHDPGQAAAPRPILAVELTNPAGEPLLLLDCGANIDSRPELYPAFAHRVTPICDASAVPRRASRCCPTVPKPKRDVRLSRRRTPLLAEQPFRFVGNIEATSALRGTADVIVCDGFHGNILLKSIEGSAKAALDEVAARLSAAGPNPPLWRTFRDCSPPLRLQHAGGSLPLLGVRKPVMKGHGSATGEAIVHMADRLALLCRNRFIERVAETVR